MSAGAQQYFEARVDATKLFDEMRNHQHPTKIPTDFVGQAEMMKKVEMWLSLCRLIECTQILHPVDAEGGERLYADWCQGH